MKIAIFEGSNTSELENQINEFMTSGFINEVVDIKQSECITMNNNEDIQYNRTITVLYKENISLNEKEINDFYNKLR